MKAAAALALLLALAPIAASAQTATDFSLPGTQPANTPRAQGPVDDEVPVVSTAPRPAPTAAATPAPAPAPAPTPSRQPGAPQLRGPSATLPPSPRPIPSATQRASSPGADADTGAAEPPAPLPTMSAVADVGSSAAGSSIWHWPLIAGAAALLVAAFGLLWRRRRKPAVQLLEFERPVVPQPRAGSAPTRQPESDTAPSGLTISLEVQRMNASLVTTTLSYVLTLTNTTDQPLTTLSVEGDMIAAHGSLPTERQITQGTERLEPRHALVNLNPGQSAQFTGDFRLPLATLVPIRAGDAAYFIPLTRWRVESSNAAGAQMVQVLTFVVGELPEQPGAALRPFRLDLGPRTYSRIGQRVVG